MALRTAIKSRRLYLDPQLTDADYLLVFKRGLKPTIRNRVEIIPDSLMLAAFEDYVLFADKYEREILATKGRTPFFELRYIRPKSSTHYPPPRSERLKRDADGDVEMSLNSLRTAPKGKFNPSKGGRRLKDKDEYRQRYINKKLYFSYGKEGHRQ